MHWTHNCVEPSARSCWMRSDFASAASSASTKLVHGGVRYLEQAVKNFNLEEYRMVKNALRERLYMLANAPYLRPSCALCGSRVFVGACRTVSGRNEDVRRGSAESNLFPSRFLSREEL